MKLVKPLVLCIVVISLLFLIPVKSITALFSKGEAKPTETPAAAATPSPKPTPTPVPPTPTPAAARGAAKGLKMIKYPEKGVPILMYHSISTNPENNLCVSVEQFDAEMEWLHSEGYYTLNMDEYCDALLSGATLPEKSFMITFDDGYVDNYTAAWPILKKYGFVGVFYIISNSVGADGSMSNALLKELVSCGNSIGSHTVHHLDLPTLTDAEQESELRDSKKALEDLLGITVKSLCYPSGKYNDVTTKLAAKLDYKMAVTTHGGDAQKSDGQYTLCRIRIPGGLALSGFKAKFS